MSSLLLSKQADVLSPWSLNCGQSANMISQLEIGPKSVAAGVF